MKDYIDLSDASLTLKNAFNAYGSNIIAVNEKNTKAMTTTANTKPINRSSVKIFIAGITFSKIDKIEQCYGWVSFGVGKVKIFTLPSVCEIKHLLELG